MMFQTEIDVEIAIHCSECGDELEIVCERQKNETLFVDVVPCNCGAEEKSQELIEELRGEILELKREVEKAKKESVWKSF